MMNQYVKVFFKKTFLPITLFIVITLYIVFFISSVIYEIKYNALVLSFPLMCAAVCAVFSWLSVVRFKGMIKKQEQDFKVQFNEKNIAELETAIYLSDDWIIAAGKSAVYKENIESIDFQYGDRYGRCKITLKTKDNAKRVIWCRKKENVKKINDWAKKTA